MKSLGCLLQLLVLAVYMTVAFVPAKSEPSRPVSAQPADPDPWLASETISPSDFAKQLQAKSDPSLKIIYVGVRTLYSGAHIPGAVFHGSGSTPQGIDELKKFAAALPKNSHILIYCGCCPLERCPNLRPAYSALHDLGFTNLKVLILPTSFAADWIEKGYPVEKGS